VSIFCSVWLFLKRYHLLSLSSSIMNRLFDTNCLVIQYDVTAVPVDGDYARDPAMASVCDGV